MIGPDANGEQFSLTSLVLPFYIPSVLSFLGSGMVIPLLALYARHLGATPAGAAFVVGLFGLGQLLFNIPAGVLITRFGKKPTLVLATILEALFAAVLGFAHTPVFLGVFVFLLGSVHTVYYVTRIVFFRSLVPAGYRGRSLALIGGCNRFGQFIGPIAGGVIAETFGYQYTLWIFSALMVISTHFLVRWIPRSKEPVSRIASIGWPGRMMMIVRSNSRTFATAGSAIIVLQIMRTARQVLIPLVGENVGLGVAQVGFIFGLTYLVEFVLFYPAGAMMDRLGRKATAVPCLTLLVVSFSVLPFVSGFATMTIVAVIAGIGNGLGSGINMTLSTDFAPPDNPAEFIGVWRFVVDAGTTGGPFLVGVVAGAMGLAGAAFVVAGVGLVGAVVMGILVPEPLRRRRRRSWPTVSNRS